MNLVFAAGVLVPQRILGHDYFRDVGGAFPGAFFPDVTTTAAIDVRAAELAARIAAQFPTGPIHVIAHSMGGLDTRCVLSRNLNGLADPGRIVSLSTISSPHRGSPIADLLVGPQPAAGVRSFVYDVLRHGFDRAGVPLDALGQLTTGFLAGFNASHPDVPDVHYFSYAGVGAESLLLKPASLYIESVGAGDDDRANDGVVTLASAKWGTFAPPTWPVDHFGELGYDFNVPSLRSSFDHVAAYRAIAERASAGEVRV